MQTVIVIALKQSKMEYATSSVLEDDVTTDFTKASEAGTTATW